MHKLIIKRITRGIDHLYTVSHRGNTVRIITDGRMAVVTEHGVDGFVSSYKCTGEAAAACLHSFQELALHLL